jgi:hypothetical protein
MANQVENNVSALSKMSFECKQKDILWTQEDHCNIVYGVLTL